MDWDVNGAVGAVTQVRADAAREAADRVDSAVRCGAPVGPLAGVPFTVKEDVALAGAATTFGVPALAGNVAVADAPPVRRLRTAGAIPLGHTNLPDLSIRFHTSSMLYGARSTRGTLPVRPAAQAAATPSRSRPG